MTFANMVLADISLTAILWWLVVGLIAGFLANMVMHGGYGMVGDIIVGIVGAFLGGLLASLIGISTGGLIGTIIIAFIGACILIAILRAVSRGTTRRRL